MTKDLNTLPKISDPSNRWALAEAEYRGSPLFIRVNTSAQDWVGHAELPIKLGFAVPLTLPSIKGFPDPDENEDLHAVEDLIIREVEAATIGIHALVLTTGQMKEFVFYIPEGVDIESLHQSIRDSVSTHDVQCVAVRDPNWDSYRQFA